MKYLIAILLALLFFSVAHAEQLVQYHVGIRQITTEVAGTEVAARIYYPTQERASKTSFGPWELVVARNAVPTSGQFPLIAVSHGLSGNDWNHHLLASQLVTAEFIVAAVRHPDDLLRVGRPAHAVLRPLELTAVIDAVLADDHFGSHIDTNKIGAFGFSLGGYTVLAAAGGKIDPSRIAAHCAKSHNDPEFCIGEEGGTPLPIWLRVRRFFYSVPQVELDQDAHDPRITVVVAAAPVGLPFYTMDRVNLPVFLIRAGVDQALRFPYHAEHIHTLLSHTHRYEVVDGVHHYAFLSPFPESIVAKIGEPAEDPKGFDREAFLAEINTAITEFFRSHLVHE